MKVLPFEQIAAAEPKPFNSYHQFAGETDHVPVIASLPRGTKIGLATASTDPHTKDGRPFSDVLSGIENPGRFAPTWSITKGEGVASGCEDGTTRP